MAEEAKNEKPGLGFKAILKIIIGLALIAAGIALVIVWIKPLLILIQGCLGLFLIMAGAITIAIAKE